MERQEGNFELLETGVPMPWWTRGEFAWASALAAGFAGSWVGMLVPVPGLAALLAVAALAPLHLGLLRREKRGLLALSSFAWALGILAAVVGVVHETPEPRSWLALVPGADSLRAWPFASAAPDPGHTVGFEGPDGPLRPPGAWDGLGRDVVVLLLLAGLARPLGGLAALGLTALYMGALGTALGSCGFAAETSGLDVLAHVPPHLALVGVAGAGLVAGLGEERGLSPIGPLDPLRWRLVAAGLGAGLLGLAGRGLVYGPWSAGLRAALEAQ